MVDYGLCWIRVTEHLSDVVTAKERIAVVILRGAHLTALELERLDFSVHWIPLVFDGFDAGDEEVDAWSAFVPPVGVKVFDLDGFACLVGEVRVVFAECRGVWREAVALLVLQVKHSRFAGAAFAASGVGALRVGRDKQFHDDWRCVVYVRFFPADDVAFVGEDAGFGDGKFRQVGTVQVGTAQVGTVQVGIAQVGIAQVGIA